jgi:hypothetical protein
VQKTGRTKKELPERGLGDYKRFNPQSYPQKLCITKMIIFGAGLNKKMLAEVPQNFMKQFRALTEGQRFTKSK